MNYFFYSLFAIIVWLTLAGISSSFSEKVSAIIFIVGGIITAGLIIYWLGRISILFAVFLVVILGL
jgi:hypothetical protein